MTKKLISKGSGSFWAHNPADTSEVLELANLSTFKMSAKVDIEDILDGNSYYAIDSLVKNKEITVTAEDVKYNLDNYVVMLGGSVTQASTTEVELWKLGEFIKPTGVGATPTAGTATLSKGAKVTTVAHIKYADTGKKLTKVTITPAVGEYKVNAAGQIDFHASDIDKDLVANYKFTQAQVEVYDILRDDQPFPISVVHDGQWRQKSGELAGFQVELYACLANGDINYEAKRGAGSSTVNLRVLDPERPDKKLGSLRRYTA